MYEALWRVLPGPPLLRVALLVLLALAVVVVCFVWVFPALAPLVPFLDQTVEAAESP